MLNDLLLDKLTLHRLHENEEAGVALCSLPIPKGCTTALSLGGIATTVNPIGLWDDHITPRRLIMAADMGNAAPEILTVSKGTLESRLPRPKFSMERFDMAGEDSHMWERHIARIDWNGKSVGLILGMKTKGTYHWWESCQLQVLSQDSFCTTFQVGGAIPLYIYNCEEFKKHSRGEDNLYLHRHHWLFGRIFARMYANGVCEIYSHHINNCFFDDGQDLPDCVPVIGLKVYDETTASMPSGAWTGDRDEIAVGSVKVNLRDAKRMVSERQPGEFAYDDRFGFFVWKPYLGAELYGGHAVYRRGAQKDGFITHAEDGLFMRGFARTVRFSLSLSDRSPVVARYLAPSWWYGHCRELTPDCTLPVSNEYDEIIEHGIEYLDLYTVNDCFEDGSIARYKKPLPDGTGRRDPSWEGEFPHGQFLIAWRSGKALDYNRAMAAAYCFSDLYIDHASNVVRMHGWAPPATSVPMFRVTGVIAAFLETGDTVLFEDAMGIVDNAYRMQRNSWPRACVGRDASFIKSAVMLWRYFDDEHYRVMARSAIEDVILTQRPDGAFGDQAGGTGIHQWATYIVKPWMGCMATGGLIDYLELAGTDSDDTRPVFECVKKFGDWLLRERFWHGGQAEGVNGTFDDPENHEACPVGMGWSYQHYYNEGVKFPQGPAQTAENLKTPYQDFWQREYLAHVLTFCSMVTGDSRYFDAWAESSKLYHDVRKHCTSDHDAIQILQFIPWTQNTLVGARIAENGRVEYKPWNFGPRTPKTATVFTPDGPQAFTL
ncbi:MAG: hypothetical protein E7463_05485 [Ruminococcaceae bacterium]|nr:hypothetical protein [Oscillospiraceae bacterium]